MQFPASWVVFCAEIPLFLSDFAETTIAPLPVLVTVTPLIPSLSSGVQLHRQWSGRGEFRAAFVVNGRKLNEHGIRSANSMSKKKASTACQAVRTLEKASAVAFTQ